MKTLHSWPLKNRGQGRPPHITYSLRMWFLSINRFNQPQSHGIVVFTTEKNLRVSGPTQFSSVCHSVVSNSLQTHELQHTKPPCPSPTPLSWWCHPTISSSVIPYSSGLQSFTASGSFQMSQFFTSGGQSTGISASTSVLPMNILKDWFPLGWTGWISLQSKGLSRVFSNTTVQKHQFFGVQPSL